MSKKAYSVTLALICYRQEKYIRDAVLAALLQNYSPLEIIISDDASPDNTYSIIQNVLRGYTGPHNIIINRNTSNMGIGAHINKLMEISSGDIIIIAAGDDISVEGRVSAIMSAFNCNPKCYLVHSSVNIIDGNGMKTGEMYPDAAIQSNPTLMDMAKQNLSIIGASGAWRRELFEKFPPLDEDVVCEDLIIPFRAAMTGEMHYIDQKLVSWRKIGLTSEFQSKRGYDVLFGSWVEWHRRWRNAYRNRAADLRHFYGIAVPQDVLKICKQEIRRYDAVVKLAESDVAARMPIIIKLLVDKSLPLKWRIKTSIMYTLPHLYSKIYDWKIRRGMIK